MFYPLQIHHAENLCSHRVIFFPQSASARMKPDHVPGQQIPSLGHHSPTTLWLLHNRFRAVRPLRFADLESKRRVYAKQTAVSQTARDLSLTLDSCESRRGLHRVIQDTGSDYRTGINRVPIHISPNCKMWRIASAAPSEILCFLSPQRSMMIVVSRAELSLFFMKANIEQNASLLDNIFLVFRL